MPDRMSGRTSEASQSHIPRVLVVEDDEPLRRVLRTALFRAGYAVADAGSVQTAREAIEVAKALQMPFDLLVVDIDLPDQTGWQLLRQLRDARTSGRTAVDSAVSKGDQPLLPLRVIVLAALRPADCRLQEFHPSGLLIKPFPLEALIQLVDRNVRAADERGRSRPVYEEPEEAGAPLGVEQALHG